MRPYNRIVLKRPQWLLGAAIGIILVAIALEVGRLSEDSSAFVGIDAATIPAKGIAERCAEATMLRASAPLRSNRSPANAQDLGRSLACSIVGRVCDVGGNAIPGTEIMLIRRELFPLLVGKFARSDANGDFQFRDLEPGTYGFRFRAPNHAVRVCYPKYVADTNIPTNVGAIALEPGATISGYVIHESGAPDRNIRVSVCWDQREEEADGTQWRVPDFVNATTDRDGRFTIRGLPRQPVAIYAVGANSIPSEEVAVSLSDDRWVVSDLVLHTYVGREIHGYVCDAAGIPIPDVDVALMEPYPATICASDAQGHFRICGLRPSNYKIRLEAKATEGRRFSPVEKTIQAGGSLETIVLAEEVVKTEDVVKDIFELEGDWK